MEDNCSKELFIRISSPQQVRAVANEILSLQREYPIIALTAHPDESEPALSVKRIREIVGPRVPIYFIPSYDLALHLSYFLPRCVAVRRGATRLWWPGASRDSRPEDRPGFYDVPSGMRIEARGDYEDLVYEWLEGEFCSAPQPRLTSAARPQLKARDLSRLSRRRRRQTNITLMGSIKILAQFVGVQLMGHAELAHRANIPRSLAHRRLVELAALGYLTETRERRYRLARQTQSSHTADT